MLTIKLSYSKFKKFGCGEEDQNGGGELVYAIGFFCF
jgi:hypothetical protein